jgi:aminopeptidase
MNKAKVYNCSLDELGKLRHSVLLNGLARVAVNVGLGLGRDQKLIITAPVEARSLVNRITKQAYIAGALQVNTFYSDDATKLARFRLAQDKSFDVAEGWLFDGIANAYRNGAARLAISGSNPALLSGQNSDRVGRFNVALSKATERMMKPITSFDINWCIVPYATPAWARLVFPDYPRNMAVAKLWDAIFAASRINTVDPVAAWQTHNEVLHSRADWLNAKRFSTLHFRGPGTDLRVGLADGHLWCGGSGIANNGIQCNPNIPTEEVFTTPHNQRTEGFVCATKPLAHQGTMLDGIRVRFEKGRIVEAFASKGKEVLEKLIASDEGSSRLGEVALVPHSSPISRSGILFYSTLFDENAASHIALGRAYDKCIINGGSMSEIELMKLGANTVCINHVDWMIGSDQVDVDGIRQSGDVEPVMRQGEWV